MYIVIVNEFVEGFVFVLGLVIDFNFDVKFVVVLKYVDGELMLNFNKNIFGNLKGMEIF